jgi:predicted metalloprotease
MAWEWSSSITTEQLMCQIVRDWAPGRFYSLKGWNKPAQGDALGWFVCPFGAAEQAASDGRPVPSAQADAQAQATGHPGEADSKGGHTRVSFLFSLSAFFPACDLLTYTAHPCRRNTSGGATTMFWKGERQSENVEDQRGLSTGKMVAAGGGGLTILLIIVGLILGVDPQQLVNQFGGGPPDNAPQQVKGKDDELKQFVATVLASTEDVWKEQFKKMGRTYREPKLVLFSGKVHSACGFADAAVGPFYCPGDEKVYLDLQFFDELEKRFQAPGNFAQAYVIAHEVGHHVQNQLGTLGEVHKKQKLLLEQGKKAAANHLQVNVELQADFYAGVWAYHGPKQFKKLEPGDLEKALKAAFEIGDDRLQKKGQGYVVPDSFTHGTSEQRMYWFRLGFDTGDVSKGDTFNAGGP